MNSKKGDHGYFIRNTACWNLGDYIKNATKGLDDPTFCQNKQDGWSCMIKEYNETRSWGYCENKQCHSCLRYGSDCFIAAMPVQIQRTPEQKVLMFKAICAEIRVLSTCLKIVIVSAAATTLQDRVGTLQTNITNKRTLLHH